MLDASDTSSIRFSRSIGLRERRLAGTLNYSTLLSISSHLPRAHYDARSIMPAIFSAIATRQRHLARLKRRRYDAGDAVTSPRRRENMASASSAWYVFLAASPDNETRQAK